MKFTEIKDKELSELEKDLKDRKREMYELRMKLKNMQLTNTNELSKVRKEIARLSTAISFKRLEK